MRRTAPFVTMSVSAVVPPYPSVTVSQPDSGTAPFLISAQSTCLSNGYANLVATVPSGQANVFELQAIHTGSCVLVFGGTGGGTLIVPVTITP